MRTFTLILIVLFSILLIGCRPADPEPTPTPAPAPTAEPVIVTVVVTATPGPTVEPLPTIEPVPTATATVAPTAVVLPTPEPVIVTVVNPTLPPEIIYETVTVPVTVVVTATATPTPTRTPTPTPTPTRTPVPTATPIPPSVQTIAGTGSKISALFNFLHERPIEVNVVVIGTGLFSLSAVTPNGCIVDLGSGTAPYTGTTIAEPGAPIECNGLHELGDGTRFNIIAGSKVKWSVKLTQYGQPVSQNPPLIGIGDGQDIFGPVRLGEHQIFSVSSLGDSGFELDVYSLFETPPTIVRVIDVPSSAIGTWSVDVPFGSYMISVNTEPGRQWTVEIHAPS